MNTPEELARELRRAYYRLPSRRIDVPPKVTVTPQVYAQLRTLVPEDESSFLMDGVTRIANKAGTIIWRGLEVQEESA